MKDFFLMVLVFVSFILTSCVSTTHEYYKSEDVKIIQVTLDENYITIIYQVPIETVYYSSGVNYSYNENTSKIELKFVKQHIKDDDKDVMIESVFLKDTEKSELAKDLGEFTYIVKIPNQNYIPNFDLGWNNFLIVL